MYNVLTLRDLTTLRTIFAHIARPTKLQIGAAIEISQRISSDEPTVRRPAVERRGRKNFYPDDLGINWIPCIIFIRYFLKIITTPEASKFQAFSYIPQVIQHNLWQNLKSLFWTVLVSFCLRNSQSATLASLRNVKFDCSQWHALRGIRWNESSLWIQ
jgi:hypothetical protein